ncbi:MAG TPA: CoA pyrophosphatase [Cyclobacteriaceae bacterium]|nr:CoA pyrophosphatase [Cyclobacteriaceae bacterium]
MSLDFNTFVSNLSVRLERPLPGAAAHEPMRATPSGNLRPDFQHKSAPRPGSVLILLYPDEGKIKFPLTKRAEYNGAHSGQVSFPGGKSEGSESRISTALREGEEEIGINKSEIKVIGQLTEFFVIPSNFIITPVVAYQPSKPVFRPDPFEVVRVLEASVEDILDEASIRIKEITAAKVYQLMAPHFVVEHEIVWGATAMMLNEFRMVVKDIL